MYVFSELPDNDDINTQVLLLGITRFETTPSPAPSKKPLTPGNNIYKAKCENDELNLPKYRSSIIDADDIGIYQSIEHLNKSTGCFPLERHKSKKTTNHNCNKPTASIIETKPYALPESRLNDQRSHRNHFDRLFERFHSKGNQTSFCINQNRRNSAEQRAFYHWLQLSRNKRLERNVKCSDAIGDQEQQTLCTPVIRKCSTKSNKIRKSTKTSVKPTTSRFSSCIPYCVTASRNNSIASNSLASNHRFTGHYCRKKSDAEALGDQHRQRLPASNAYLMHSHCKSNKHYSPSNKYTDNNHNNNCSSFNNLNIMDRSVDSIGSCSLDVDAESTDFSGIPI